MDGAGGPEHVSDWLFAQSAVNAVAIASVRATAIKVELVKSIRLSCMSLIFALWMSPPVGLLLLVLHTVTAAHLVHHCGHDNLEEVRIPPVIAPQQYAGITAGYVLHRVAVSQCVSEPAPGRLFSQRPTACH